MIQLNHSFVLNSVWYLLEDSLFTLVTNLHFLKSHGLLKFNTTPLKSLIEGCERIHLLIFPRAVEHTNYNLTPASKHSRVDTTGGV